MKLASISKKQPQNHFFKTEEFPTLFFYVACFLSILLWLYNFFYTPRNIKQASNWKEEFHQTNIFVRPKNDISECDIFKGRWIADERGSLYTNYSCKTIPYQRNCFLHGRKDNDFLNWRWKPDQCELPGFMPEKFLRTVQGKTMAFIGDSLARNHMDSLLCLLSTVETPKALHKDMEDRFATWEFLEHNFTLMALWSQFLMAATEQVINGTATGQYDLQLDKADDNWSKKLPLIDYAIFSVGQWFFRPNYFYENGNFIGTTYFQTPNITIIRSKSAIRKAFRVAFAEINKCKTCTNILALLRTSSPQHYENGEWNSGGVCNRTRPIEKEEVNKSGIPFEYRNGSPWEYKEIQVEEFENAKRLGEESGKKFEILDVTDMMFMRPDGHPGVFGGNTWLTGYSDCVHWCLPGPIDAWNELLLEVIRRRQK